MPRVNVKDKRKQQLIDANMASIAKRGLVDTTIAHVSDGANMSRGIVNFYFTSKEKMMQETLIFLLAEQTACWQEALTAAHASPAAARIEVVMRALMGDKLCSQRRLAVLSAFLGHAGTHMGYAKLIKCADDGFIKQMKILWQDAGMDTKLSEVRAKQMLAFIRGHQLMSFLSGEAGKPSSYGDHWRDILQLWAQGLIPSPQAKTALPATPAKHQKKLPPGVLPGQLDFGDLFVRE